MRFAAISRAASRSCLRTLEPQNAVSYLLRALQKVLGLPQLPVCQRCFDREIFAPGT